MSDGPAAAAAGGDRPSAIVAHVWRQHRRWSAAADRLKRRIDRARTTGLVLGIVGAVLAVAAVQVGTATTTGRALAVVAGVAVGLVPLVRRAADQDAVRDWTRARSISEGLKSEVYSYLGGASRYLGSDRDRVLAATTRELLDGVGDLAVVVAHVDPDDRPVPAVHGVEDYLEQRVLSQARAYYVPRARRYAGRLRRLRVTESVLGAVAVVLAVLVGAGGIQAAGAWVAVVSTIAASLAAHAGAARYDQRIIGFTHTATRLEGLAAAWQVKGWSPAALVEACEEAISVENQGWMARLTREEPGPGHGGQAQPDVPVSSG